MKRLIKKCSIFILGLLITMLSFSNAVFAKEEGSYKYIDAEKNVAVNKIWIIKLNEYADVFSINNKNIKVLDENENEVNIKVSYDKNEKAIYVSPQNHYEFGKSYTLVIEKLKSDIGIELNEPVKMNFTIKNDSLPVKKPDSDVLELFDKHTYEITDILTVECTKDTVLNLVRNIGTLSNSPYQKETDLSIKGNNAKLVTDPEGRKQFVVNSKFTKGKKESYEIIRVLENSALRYKVDLSKTSGDYSSFLDYIKYTSPQSRIESDNPMIKEKAEELFKGIKNPYIKAKKAFEFVTTYITYDTRFGNKGALSALATSKGVCEEYADLFVALLRASGVPARVVIGRSIELDKFDENGFADMDKSWNRFVHSWAEFYLPEYGWVVVDPTVTYNANDKKAVNFDQFALIRVPGHIVQGYDVAGECDDNGTLYKARSNSMIVDIKTYIRIIK